MIVKNEAHNLPRLFESIEGCFDEIHITDTGSTDDTVEVAKRLGATVHHFEWCMDFSAARNASFLPIKTDFVMWMDGDDVLENKDAFIKWRDDAMGLAEYWVATYHYASDSQTGKPVCSFARERVFRTDRQMKWKYFVHEGVVPQSDFGQVRIQYVPTWAIRHKRTEKDMQQDRSRNIKLFETRKQSLDGRMTYYYGKELFEAGQPLDAAPVLLKAIAMDELEPHDRILGIQYACYAYMACNQFDRAIQLALQGIQLVPNRAEFHVLVGDCWLKLGRIMDAIPSYAAAKNCVTAVPTERGFAGTIFNHEDAYTIYPRNQLARIYAQSGDLSRAETELLDAMKIKLNAETNTLLEEVTRLKKLTDAKNYKTTPCDDIVISAPGGMYEWDADIATERGVGGSETAAIWMAYWLHKLSGRPVKVFNQRTAKKLCDGVEYLPVTEMGQYLSTHLPFAHIAWRHNVKLTEAPTYFWCHDLMAMGGENTAIYDKLLCLSPFHSRYVQAMQGIPKDKIILTRNGIDPEKFEGEKPAKNPNKIIFPSSPDRGLDRAMRIMDRLLPEFPDLELHVFYGFDNLYKSGPEMTALADRLKVMIAERPWVKYHGNVQQDLLAKHSKEAVLWLHPANFIESFCITALEMPCSGTYTLTRRMGALQDTCRPFEEKGMATVLDIDCETERDYQIWADEAAKILREKRWEKVSVNPEDYSWKSVAQEWLDTFLNSEKERVRAVG
jgi:glycosyltransferase involved in cell wall biosynthesis